MTLTTATVILLGSFLILFLLHVPIALSLTISSILTGLYLGIPLEVIGQRMLNGLNSFAMMAIPLFIFAGEIMGEGGLSSRLVRFSNLLVGRLRGGLAIVNILSTMFFGGITGSAVADASAIGSIMIPMMRMRGYDKDFAVGVTTTGAIQGVLLPPSHNIILYSLVAGGVSIPALFAAGLVPGISLGIVLMICSYIIAIRRRYPRGEKIPREEWMRVVIEGLLSLTPALIIVIGILAGVFTANESAAIAVVYALLLVTLGFREVNAKKLHQILISTFRRLSVVLFLIASSSAFAWLLSYLHVPELVLGFITSLTTSRVGVFLLINLILLFLGMIMDMAPLILITTPILLPVAVKYGMDPVQFGVMLMLNLGIGLLTPPVGSAIYVGCSLGELTLEEAFKAILPFLAVMVCMLMLITFIPGISMSLPKMLVH
ncbi:TRAP-type C4-dicarboxylate transport system, large permease component [Moorella thermoacetica Y72]|uniref:Sialic acid TRAP transporter permease protein SiaT n=2 Tax=Neomoorella thermoacetica TaxID=1525 RepID=A0A1J5JER7_NEOTH|nr:TRAP transporter large permease [Moorella thermoacetica]APC07507.1 sialic acid TRAP transporter permease protein SiaT [Moorella thermoacetica]OIQ08026.1 sialic acid TRAP transporter permease protein SiaT [Moorella thermoacetica]GAF26109.1 TRAP-type C4-dicarboxylate transport system, large permease component [Moorella thermoacetica Y72]